MFTTLRLKGLCAFLALACCLAGPAAAQDADTQEALRYQLTESGLARFTQATRALAALPAACDSAAEDEGDDAADDGGDDGSNPESIREMVALYDAAPGVKAAIQSAGMTTREYVVFTLSVLHNGIASWAASQPGGKLPPGASQANVDFIRAHEADLERLKDVGKPRCDEATGDQE